jgi:thioredoxin-like negative regulator of GroEL
MLCRLAIAAGLLAISLGACSKDAATPAKQDDRSTAAAACPGVQKGPIRWIEDDWPAALACAKARKVPIVLDLWAPWCHTCIAMQTTVFMDPSFEANSETFVWLALDADRPENAVPVGAYATSAMPTFYVIGADEQVLARFVGGATLQQFHEFIDAGARVARGGIAAADTRLVAGERALAAKDLATGETEITAALAAAPPAWPRRAEAVASLQLTKKKRRDYWGCVELSAANLDAVGTTATATNFWATAIECVGSLAAAPSPGADPAVATTVQDRAIANLAAVLADPKAPLSIDDRAEAYAYLRDAQAAHGKLDEADATAETLRRLLDEAWSAAPTAFARMTYLWPRAEAYAYLKRPLELVVDYKTLATELPTEYDVPARLGWLYLKAGKYAEAATWTDKALALVYGPRKARLFNQRAEIAAGAGDTATERAMRESAVSLWESLPAGPQNPDALAKAKAELAAMN